MPSDKQQFERALQKWDSLKQARSFSAPEHIGRTAIIVSLLRPFETMSDDSADFVKEAYHLADTEREQGFECELAINATGADIKTFVKDPRISNIVTIGHGALSYLYVSNGTRKKNLLVNDRYDWRDISNDSDHLKTGYFVQRHCGNATRKLSVPLGSFLMSEHNSVLATFNEGFAPQDLPANIFDLPSSPTDSRLSYKQIKTVYSNEAFLAAIDAE